MKKQIRYINWIVVVAVGVSFLCGIWWIYSRQEKLACLHNIGRTQSRNKGTNL